MDAPCCFNTFASGAGLSFQSRPVLICPQSIPSCSTAPSNSFFPLVAASAGARRGDKSSSDDGAGLSMTQLMFRNMAALLYRSVPRKPKAEPAGSSSRFPPPDSDSDEESDEQGEGAAAAGEDGVSLGMAEELECLEEEAIAGPREGREPADYDRRAHLFDESSRVFQGIKEREEGRRGSHHEGS